MRFRAVACFSVTASIAIGGLLLAPKVGAAEPAAVHGSGDSEFSLAGVSCASPSDCMAVGSYDSAKGTSVPFSEDWDGTSWSSIPVSAPKYSELSDVECFNSSDCLAVGSTRYGTLAERWNGTDWTVVPSPAPKDEITSELASLSCFGPRNCQAVGYYVRSSSSSSTYLTLAASWNGTKWVEEASPNPSGVTGSELFGVSCTDTDSCVAVGDSFNSVGNSHNLTEAWNGTSWALLPSVDEHPGQENTLAGVDCTSDIDCIAVGSYFTRTAQTLPLIEQFDGSGWTIVTGATHEGALLGLSCSSSSSCMAVGFSSSGTFTEMMSGSTWTVETSPNPKGTGHSALLVSVSCAQEENCQAVGLDTGKGSDTSYNLIESWNGSRWEIVRSAKPN
jgi:hypothetical protein